MLETTKQELTAELRGLEANKDGDAVGVARQTKTLLDKVKALPAWDDSRSSTGASFKNLINDTNIYKEYLTAADIKARATELLVYLSHRMTPAQAQSIGIAAFQKASSSAETLEQTQRMSEPGSSIFETARELPDPLIDETKRRASQAGAVVQVTAERLKPATDSLKDRLIAEGWTIPAVLAVVAGLMIFSKNKMLAATLSGLFVYGMFKWGLLTPPALLK